MIVLAAASTFGVGAEGSVAIYAFSSRLSELAATATGAALGAPSCAHNTLAQASQAVKENANATPLRKTFICEVCEEKKFVEHFMPPQNARQHPSRFGSKSTARGKNACSSLKHSPGTPSEVQIGNPRSRNNPIPKISAGTSPYSACTPRTSAQPPAPKTSPPASL